jgi:hypothetical protein
MSPSTHDGKRWGSAHQLEQPCIGKHSPARGLLAHVGVVHRIVGLEVLGGGERGRAAGARRGQRAQQWVIAD